MRMQRLPICVSLLVLLVGLGADQAPSTVHIQGAGVTASDWSADQIQTQLASDVQSVQYKNKGADHTFSCVPLVSLLKAAGVETSMVMNPKADPKTKNPQMRRVLIVSGRDGYTVVFSMAEVMPMVGKRAVWVAFQEDGKPLADNDGPVRLIVPEDGMPARGVHEVATIDVEELSAPTTQPTAP
jgi:hypothetical protein